jgi:hypothetical protein
VDEICVVSSLDLHGSIAGSKPGFYVSTRKDDMKLSAGSELALAIAAHG